MYTLHLGSVGGGPFEISADKMVTGRTCILGSSGSGRVMRSALFQRSSARTEFPSHLWIWKEIPRIEGEVRLGLDRGRWKMRLRWNNLNIEELDTYHLTLLPWYWMSPKRWTVAEDREICHRSLQRSLQSKNTLPAHPRRSRPSVLKWQKLRYSMKWLRGSQAWTGAHSLHSKTFFCWQEHSEPVRQSAHR